MLIIESNSTSLSSGYKLIPQRLNWSEPFSKRSFSRSAWSSASMARRFLLMSTTALTISPFMTNWEFLRFSQVVF